MVSIGFMLLISLFSFSAYAFDEIDSKKLWYVGFSGGVTGAHNICKDEHLSCDNYSTSSGLIIGRDINHWSLKSSLNWLGDFDASYESDSNVEASIWSATFEANYNFSVSERLNPYLGAGLVGYYTRKESASIEQSHYSTSPVISAGLEFEYDKDISFFTEYRYMPFNDGPLGDADLNQVYFGFKYYFF